jgi:cytochrome b involved in lipid metabolism
LVFHFFIYFYVTQHDTEEDCWLVIGNDNNGGAMVYDVTKYLSDHPGGPEIMLEFAGIYKYIYIFI